MTFFSYASSTVKFHLFFFFHFRAFTLFYFMEPSSLYPLKALRRGLIRMYVCTNFLETFMATVGILVDALNLTSLHLY